VAFTAAQKRDIRKYLGVPFGFYDLNTRLESMINKVGADPTDEAEVTAWLAELAVIDETVASDGATSHTHGALKKVDEVEFHPITADSAVAVSVGAIDRGRMIIKRLARALGVDDVLPNGDYFSGAPSRSVLMRLG
jgi:hypothetical protein